MMNYLKITLFVLLVLVFSTYAGAAIQGTGRSPERDKVSIIGHTGQDPVYKSLDGKQDLIDSKQNSKYVRMILQDDFSRILFDNLLDTNELPIIFNTKHDFEFLDTQFNSITGFGVQTVTKFTPIPIPNSSELPAPPAFLLVLAGLVSRKRRKS